LGRSLFIFRISGVPVQLHWTYPLLVLYFTWGPLLDVRTHPQAFLQALITVALLSGAILCHELAHMAAARKVGVRVKSIVLWSLGGLTELADRPATPRGQVIISLAGPACTLALAGIGHALSGLPGAFGEQMADFAFYNFWMFCFNLIPAYPLDGGQALQAILHGKMGEARADLMTARVGIGASICIAVAGIITGERLLLVIGILTGIYAFDLLRRNQFAGYSAPAGRATGGDDVRAWRLSQDELAKEIKRKRAADKADKDVREKVDALLKQISENGIDSLDEKDRAFLQAASRRMRKRGR